MNGLHFILFYFFTSKSFFLSFLVTTSELLFCRAIFLCIVKNITKSVNYIYL